LQTAPADDAHPPMRELHTPSAESAPNTKDHTKVDTKEDGSVAPTILRIRERDAKRMGGKR
jgi:hypothetical protein